MTTKFGPGPINKPQAQQFARGMNWIKVSARLKHIEGVAMGIIDYPSDPRNTDAKRLLDLVDQIRREYKSGFEISGKLIELEALCAASNKRTTEPMVSKGLAFSSPKPERRDALAKLAFRALKKLGQSATAKMVLDEMVLRDMGKVIQDIDPDDNTISWKNGVNERTTSFHGLEKRLTGYRKKLFPIPD